MVNRFCPAGDDRPSEPAAPCGAAIAGCGAGNTGTTSRSSSGGDGDGRCNGRGISKSVTIGMRGTPFFPGLGDTTADLVVAIGLRVGGNELKSGNFDGCHLGGVWAPVPAADNAGPRLTLVTRSKELALISGDIR